MMETATVMYQSTVAFHTASRKAIRSFWISERGGVSSDEEDFFFHVGVLKDSHAVAQFTRPKFSSAGTIRMVLV